MELAVNTFAKGLQMDTNPMVLGNDTLSDALNATFVTMNGNEVILQNDMGNRRIDHAYLPSGYEPVGMKEYGGIIYVAAYNPLTKRCQIGSFPSPERKFGIGNIPKVEFNFYDFIEVNRNDISNPNDDEYYVKTNSIITLLTEKTILHAGDRFNILSTNISSNDDNIIQYIQYLIDKSINNKKYKNLFTFKIGVLNSLNEFVDITSSLKTYDNNYFIKKVESQDIETEELLSYKDKELELERGAYEDTNIYSYKIVSPLYLKAELNYIRSIIYHITGDKIEENKYCIYIEAEYYHENEINFNDYKPRIEFTDETGTINYNIEEIDNVELYSVKSFNEKYDSFNNYYITTVNYEVNIQGTDSSTVLKMDHYLWPKDFYDDKEVYIKELHYEYLIDLNKLGSDTIEFQKWQYYNKIEEKYTRFRIDFLTYPKNKNSILKNLYLGLTKVDGNINTEFKVPLYISSEENLTIPSGIFEGTFNWYSNSYKNNKIEPQTLYTCQFYYGYDNNGTIDYSPSITPNGAGFFLSTTLFNGNYNGYEGLRETSLTNTTLKNYTYEYDRDVYINDFSKIEKIQVVSKLSFDIETNKGLNTQVNNYDDNYTKYILSETFETINEIKSFSIGIENEELYPSPFVLTRNGNNDYTINNKSILINGKEIRTYTNNSNTINSSNLNNLNSELLEQGIQEQTTLKDKSNLNIDIINAPIITENVDNNLNKFKLEITINNAWNGSSSNRLITAMLTTTSFRKLIDNLSLDRVRKPYFSIDSENGDFISLTVVERESEDPTYLNASSIRLGGEYSLWKETISEFINSNNNDLFIAETNTDDHMIAENVTNIRDYGPSFVVIDGNNGRLMDDITGNSSSLNRTYIIGNNNRVYTFQRIWFRYGEHNYVPILICTKVENQIFTTSDANNYSIIVEFIKDWAKRIPYYYTYNKEQNKEYSINLIDFTSPYNISKKFEYNVSILLNYTKDYLVPNHFNNYFEIDNNKDNTYEIKQQNIYSDSKFFDMFEKMKGNEFECVGIIDISNGEIRTIVDSNGDFLNSLYIYTIENNKLKKFNDKLIPDNKYTIGNDIQIPNFYKINGEDNVDMLFMIQSENIDIITNRLTPNYNILNDLGKSLFRFDKLPNIYTKRTI